MTVIGIGPFGQDNEDVRGVIINGERGMVPNAWPENNQGAFGYPEDSDFL